MVCRHTHLQQQLHLEDVQLLHPLEPAKDSVDSTQASHTSSRSDPTSSVGQGECGNTASGVEITGVTHVGLLRAGSVRHVVAGLADGQLLMYRENGVQPTYCSSSCWKILCSPGYLDTLQWQLDLSTEH